MALILNLETSSTVCSAALGENGVCIAVKEIDGGYTHAENLTVFAKEVMMNAGKKFGQLDAVAVSMGPGSYTGLRIGLSAAKGLCYALNIPLLGVETLKSLASPVVIKMKGEKSLYCPMMDAKRMEVYCAVYDHELNAVYPPQPLVLGEKALPFLRNNNSLVYFFGSGSAKYKPLVAKNPQAVFLNDIHPSAIHMLAMSEQLFHDKKFESTAYAEPRYLKDFTGGGSVTG